MRIDRLLSDKAYEEVEERKHLPNLGSFPAQGETGVIYVALDTSIPYYWNGTSYVVLGEASIKVNRTVYVDGVFGNDSTGQLQEMNKPFKTIQAAIDITL